MIAPSLDTGTVRFAPRGAAYTLFRTETPEVLIEGPAGTGKSYACLWLLHTLALKYPGMRALMLRKRNTDLVGSVMVTYKERVLNSGEYYVKPHGGSAMSPHEFRYERNGSKIITGGMDSESKVLSAEYDIIYANEATELTEADWETLTSRLRYGVLPYQQIIGDCNPAASAHWLNLRFPPADEPTERRVRLLSRHVDNPEMWDFKRQRWTGAGTAYVSGFLATLTGAQRERLLEGKWASVQGAVYPDFDRNRHVGKVDTDGWATLATIDIGTSNPTAILTLRYAGDRIHVEREVYQRELDAEQIVEAIAGYVPVRSPVMIDPSARAYIKALQRRGYRAEKADNAVPEGIAAVRAVLRSALLTIDPSCVNTINEFESYAYYSDNRVSDLPKKEFDHAMDALRYGVMKLTAPPPRYAQARSF